MGTWVWVVLAVLAAIVLLGAFSSGTRARKRQQPREEIDRRPLSPESRSGYVRRWVSTQTRFVDDPQGAQGEADALLREVLEERGFPPDEFEQYRAPSGDSRQSVRHYRVVFAELLAAGNGANEEEEEEERVELGNVARLR